jgi:hypothetical protein
MELHAFKNEISLLGVIPAKAGTQEKRAALDPGFLRGDDEEGFLGSAKVSCLIKRAVPAASG